jgi:hypothetical protein
MADSILRLRIESNEYDAKLKKAAEGIQQLAKSCHDAGGVLNVLEDENRDYIKSLGNMATAAHTTKGKLREMTSAFTEIKSVYNSLTTEEKNGEFGRELNKQLETLKGRIRGSRDEISSINNELTGESGFRGALDAVSSVLGVNITKLAGLGTALGAAKAALDVAKDAFLSSEANFDEWQGTIESAESVYKGFLNSINNGDISGFLGHIDDIVDAARKAYDELDKLGTMKTIQGPKMSAQQTENERFRDMLRTGRYIAPSDGRKATMKQGAVLSSHQLKNLERQLNNGMKNVNTLIQNEIKQTNRAVGAYYNKLAKENGMSYREFRRGTSSWSAFSQNMSGYENYKRFERQHTRNVVVQSSVGALTQSVRDSAKNPYERYRKWGTFRVDAQGKGSYNDLVALIKQGDQQRSQLYSSVAQSYRTMNRVNNRIDSQNKKNSSGGKHNTVNHTVAHPVVHQTLENKKDPTIQQQIADLEKEAYTATDERREAIALQVQELDNELAKQKEIREELHGINEESKPEEVGLSGLNTNTIDAYKGMLSDSMKNMDFGSVDLTSAMANMVDVTTLSNFLTTAFQEGIDLTAIQLSDGSTASDLWDKILSGENIDDSVWEELEAKVNEKLSQLGIDPIKIDVKTGNMTKGAKDVEDSWEDAARAVQAVGGALSNIKDPGVKIMSIIAEAVATIALTFAKSLKGTVTPWDWIAAAATGAATMVGVISTIHSSTGYANGGVVDGQFTGNTYSGDQIPVMVNAGETILTRAQAGNIASQLSDNNRYTPRLMAEVSGEQIRLVLRNWNRRTGIGEMAMFQ